MKKTVTILNLLLIAAVVISCVCYDRLGGLWLKAFTSSLFSILGLVNLLYAIKVRTRPTAFPALLFAGLFLCTCADVILWFDFIVGTAVFALGHIFYVLAYRSLLPFRKSDWLPCAVIFAFAAGLILFAPFFDFGEGPMQPVCLAYAAIISCMLGKAIANLCREKTALFRLIAAGSALFFFSDLMLVLNLFADAPPITDTLCLFTYFPGQALLASSAFLAVKNS